jgi:uncharacterized protein (DUF1697 family)
VAENAARGRHVLLLRGVNVGGNKRVPMADLRTMLTGLGYRNARTILNSGNAVFDVPRATPAHTLAVTIGKAVEKTFGFASRPFVFTAADLDAVVGENTLAAATDNPSRLMVAYFASAADSDRVAPLARRSWAPEGLVVGSKAAYVWCPRSVLDSPVFEAVGRALGTGVTTRNWATTLKLQALCREG